MGERKKDGVKRERARGSSWGTLYETAVSMIECLLRTGMLHGGF